MGVQQMENIFWLLFWRSFYKYLFKILQC